jgi:hypothetical protein
MGTLKLFAALHDRFLGRTSVRLATRPIQKLTFVLCRECPLALRGVGHPLLDKLDCKAGDVDIRPLPSTLSMHHFSSLLVQKMQALPR